MISLWEASLALSRYELVALTFGGTMAKTSVQDSEGILFALKNIGRMIGRARRNLGLTQDDLASRAGIRQAYLSAIERGQALGLTTNVFLEICSCLGVPPYEILIDAYFAPSLPILTGEQKGKLVLAIGILQDLRRAADRAAAQ